MKAAFNTPFELQLEFLKKKLRLPTAKWDDIWQAAHDRAFVVAGAAKADLLADLHAAVIKAAAEGRGILDFRKDFRAVVEKHGWHGWTGEGTKAGQAWRTKVIYQTNMATSHAAGRWAQVNDPDLDESMPYLMYHHGDGVIHPRPHHVAWNGLVLPKNHPFWKTHAPPNGWGCHCYVTAATAKDYAAGKTAPPEGWDEVSAKTGAPEGIDKGWGYAPGASRIDELSKFVEEKALKLPGRIGQAFREEMGDNGGVRDNLMFQEEKTAKAAAKWAVKNNLVDFADYTGVKPEVANAFNRSLFDHLREFPELRSQQKFMGTCQAQFAKWREIEMQKYILKLQSANPHMQGHDFRPHAKKHVKALKVDRDTYAHSWAQQNVSGIAVNKTWGADVTMFEKSLLNNVQSKHHPVGCNTIKSVVDHEFGHELDKLLGLEVDSAVIQAYTEATVKGIKEEVSGYAARNIKEFIAECWAESCNNTAPRAFAQKIAGIVRAKYATKYP